MKRSISIFFISFFFSSALLAQHPTTDPNWQIVFQDDFSSFNNTIWHKEIGPHAVGKPDEGLTYNLPANVFILGGRLYIVTKREQAPLCEPQCIYNRIHQYTSATVTSNAEYPHGYFEIYAKLPASNGYWPGFWLWTYHENICCYNEIDIFEALGRDPYTVISNVHWDFSCPLDEPTDNKVYHFIPQRYDSHFHWYGVEWDSTCITWYIDRTPVRKVRNDYGGIGIQHDMHISIDVYLSNWGDDTVNTTTIFPNYMQIEDAGVYRLKCDCSTVIVEIPDFSTYQYGVKKSISLSGVTQLPADSTICLRARDYIELTNGFEVPIGTSFYADVNPCP